MKTPSAELAASIATHGLIQPIRVRAAEQGGYIIVCGERRDPCRATARPNRNRSHRRYRPRGRTGDLPTSRSRRTSSARRCRRSTREAEAYKAAMQSPRRGRRRRGRTLRQKRAVYLLPDELELIPDAKKLLREKLHYAGPRHGAGTVRERPAKDDLQRPPQRRGGVAEILRKGVSSGRWTPIIRTIWPGIAFCKTRRRCARCKRDTNALRYVRHGKRTAYEPGMSRSQKPRIHRAKKRRTARAKPEIHPLQRPLRMRRP